EPHGELDGVEEGVRGVVEEEVGLVEEEDELGPLEVADLGQLLEEVGEQPHEEGREDHRLALDARELEAADNASAVGGEPHEVRGVELRLAEEDVATRGGEPDELAEDDAGGRLREPTERPEVLLALVGHEVLEDGLEILEVEEREPALVGPVEDE